jgi:hypothetical protein
LSYGPSQVLQPPALWASFPSSRSELLRRTDVEVVPKPAIAHAGGSLMKTMPFAKLLESRFVGRITAHRIYWREGGILAHLG